MKPRAKRAGKWMGILLLITTYFTLLVLISRLRSGTASGAVPVVLLCEATFLLCLFFAAKHRKPSNATGTAIDTSPPSMQEGQRAEREPQAERERWFDFLSRAAICAFAVFLFCRAFLGPLWYAELDNNALPVIALQYRGSYVLNEEDVKQAIIDFPQLYPSMEEYESRWAGKPVATADGHWMPGYGPIYPLLCIPIKLLLSFLYLDQERCFLLTNAVLIVSALCFLHRKLRATQAQRFLALLMQMISPIVFYVNYINYESCIYSLLIISLTLYYNGNRKRSALVLSLAGIANHTVMAAGIVMIGEYLIQSVRAIKSAPDKKHILRTYMLETLAYGCCFIPCLIPFAAQLILLDGSLFASMATLESLWPRFFSYLFDPSLGFFSFAPLAILAFFVLGIISLFQKQSAKRWRALPWLLFLVGTVLAYSLMYHINCGMIYCARYLVWTYPIVVIFLATIGYETIHAIPMRQIGSVALVASSLFLFAVNFRSALDCYSFNPMTRWILDRVPQVYEPLSSTFYSRVLHEDGPYWHTEPAYYLDSQTDEVRKVLYKAYPGVEEELLGELTGDEASLQFLYYSLKELKYDDEYHYLDLPKSGPYQLHRKTPEEKGEFVPGKVLIDEENVLLLPNAGIRSVWIPTTISANTWYKIEIELDGEFDFDDADGLFVDFWGDGYDYAQQESYFLVSGRYRYELYFNSGDFDWDTKDIIVRLTCAASQKGQETLRIEHFTLTESAHETAYPPIAFWTASYFDGSERDAHLYFPYGMSDTEDHFAWTDRKSVQCCFSLLEDSIDDIQLRLDLLRVYCPPQRMQVTCADRILYDAAISDNETEIIITIPADCIQDGKVSLVIYCPDAASPASMGESEDSRELAFAIKAIEITR